MKAKAWSNQFICKQCGSYVTSNNLTLCEEKVCHTCFSANLTRLREAVREYNKMQHAPEQDPFPYIDAILTEAFLLCKDEV